MNEQDPLTVFVKGLKSENFALKAKLEKAEAKLKLMDSHRDCASLTEKQTCEKGLIALASVRHPTPEEGYGFNVCWLVDDLCKALTAANCKIEEMRQALKEFYDLGHSEHCSAGTGLAGFVDGRSGVHGCNCHIANIEKALSNLPSSVARRLEAAIQVIEAVRLLGTGTTHSEVRLERERNVESKLYLYDQAAKGTP